MSVAVWRLYSADVSRHLPGSCTLLLVMTAALHLTLISLSLQRPNKPNLQKQLFFTFIPVSQLKLN